MELSIPDTVELYTQERVGGAWKWGRYCFAHAVLRALEGENTRVQLITDAFPNACDDYKNFGPPQKHNLGSLR